MSTLEVPLMLTLGFLSLIAVLLVGTATFRLNRLNRRHRKASGEADRVRALVERHAADDFARVDRLLFDLRDVRDNGVLDDALRRLDDEGRITNRPEVQTRLRKVYDVLGLVDLHLSRVREAKDWRRRTDSALLLARLGDLRAIPVLAECLRDPYEDERTVKQAAARALGAFRVEGTAEALLEELRVVNEWSSPRIAEVLVDLRDQAVQPTVAALNDEAENLRSWAAQVLSRIGDPTATPALIDRMNDRSAQVRLAATEALGRLADRRAVGALSTAVLRDPVSQVRAEAARALGKIGDAAASATLVTALSDSDYWTRLRAVEALEQLRPDDPALLLEAARDNRVEVSKAAGSALDRIGFVQHWIDELGKAPGARLETARAYLTVAAKAGAVDTLVRQMGAHGDFRTRARLAELLGGLAIEDAIEPLAQACEDEQWPVRVQALGAYGRLGPDNLQPILRALEDREEMVRHAAAQALLALGPRRELADQLEKIIEPLASSPNAEIRKSVLDLLSNEGGPLARRVANQLLDDPEPTIRAKAAGQLAKESGPGAVRALGERLHDPSVVVRTEAARALGELGTPEAIEALIEGTLDADDPTRDMICEALARQGFEALLDTIDAFMGATDVRARLAVVWTLGKTKDPRAISLLVASLGDDRPRVRASAAGALGRYTDAKASAALIGALEDRSEFVRAAACNALGRSDWDMAGQPLLGQLQDPDFFVRRRALVALGTLQRSEVLGALLPFLDDEGDEGGAAHAAIGLALLDQTAAARALGQWLARPGRNARLLDCLGGERPETQERVRAFLGLHPQDATEAEMQEWGERLRRTLTGSRDAEERLRAAELLAAWPQARSPAWLEAAIRTDPDPRIRKRAVELLASDDLATSQVITRALQDPDAEVRQAALSQAGRFPEIGPAVLATAVDGEAQAHTQNLVIDALAEQFANSPAELVDLLMGQERRAARLAAVQALGRIADPSAVSVLRLMMSDDEPQIRAICATALGNVGEGGLAELDGALEDPDEEVRVAALVALWRLDRESIHKALEILRADPSVAVRMELARRLGEDNTERSQNGLLALSNDPHPGVRREALCSLLMPGTPECIGTFLHRIESLDAVEKTMLRQELLSRGQDEEVADWLRTSRDPKTRAAAARLLHYTGVDTQRGPLLDALADRDATVRLEAVRTLSSLDDDLIRQQLTQAAHDPDPRVRAVARKVAGLRVL